MSTESALRIAEALEAKRAREAEGVPVAMIENCADVVKYGLVSEREVLIATRPGSLSSDIFRAEEGETTSAFHDWCKGIARQRGVFAISLGYSARPAPAEFGPEGMDAEPDATRH